MPAKNRETPRERYASTPLTEEERHDLPIKIRQAVAMGTPIIIEGTGGDALQLEVFGCSINTDGDILLSARFTGTVRRPGHVVEAKGVTQPITIPAK